MTQKDINRWTTQKVVLGLAGVTVVASIGLAAVGVDITQLVALSALVFTYAGAITRFNYTTSPSKEEEPKDV